MQPPPRPVPGAGNAGGAGPERGGSGAGPGRRGRRRGGAGTPAGGERGRAGDARTHPGRSGLFPAQGWTDSTGRSGLFSAPGCRDRTPWGCFLPWDTRTAHPGSSGLFPAPGWTDSTELGAVLCPRMLGHIPGAQGCSLPRVRDARTHSRSAGLLPAPGYTDRTPRGCSCPGMHRQDPSGLFPGPGCTDRTPRGSLPAQGWCWQGLRQMWVPLPGALAAGNAVFGSDRGDLLSLNVQWVREVQPETPSPSPLVYLA